MKTFVHILLAFCAWTSVAQDIDLPYRDIPDPPSAFTAGAVASRLVDGIAFRYYWATEGLAEDDLSFRPGNEARSTMETLRHIYDMSVLVLNATLKVANPRPTEPPSLSFSEFRRQTLGNLQKASSILREASDSEMEKFMFVFYTEGESITFPFWNGINGPITDIAWHVGQVVSFRRTSGNPLPAGVNLLTGKGPAR